MSEAIDFDSRVSVAARMTGDLSDINSGVMFDRPRGRFVMELAQGGFIGEPLGRAQADDRTDLPRHWRFLVPASARVDGLVPVEFGRGTDTLTAMQEVEYADTYEEAIDEVLHRERELKLPVGMLYPLLGSAITKKVTDSGDPLFAGIEWRFEKGTIDENPAHGWPQLIYSRQLAKTGSLIPYVISRMEGRGRSVPSWMYEARRPDLRQKVAGLMALSALAHFMDMEPGRE